MRKKRTEIMIETDRTIVYTRIQTKQTHWCEVCSAQVEMVTAFQAARMTGVSSYTIFSRAQEGEIHSVITATGVLLLCLRSLCI
jgi:hypothetical protein